MAESHRKNWTRAESLIAFRLYCALPFGQLSHTTPDVMQLAQHLGRTPSSVSMKACNFARLDPLHQARGVKGLEHGARLEETIWNEFHADSEALANEAEAAYEALLDLPSPREGPGEGAEQLPSPWEGSGEGESQSGLTVPELPETPDGPTESLATIKTRRVQRFFRTAVLSGYRHRCALTGLAVPALLNASHIIPWAAQDDPNNQVFPSGGRADPRNGLCLNALHDRAFDRGLMTFDEELRAVFSKALPDDEDLGKLLPVFRGRGIEGERLTMPERFGPLTGAMAYHRERVFQSA